MELEVDRETEWLRNLPKLQRARFLALLSHNLTIGVRVLCHSGEESKEALECVRLLNEAHHRVSSYLSHTHAGDEDPGWLHVVANYALERTNPVVYLQAAHAWQGAKVSLRGSSAA